MGYGLAMWDWWYYGVSACVCFFKQKTAYDMRISDWSSDVCSSDLGAPDGRFASDPVLVKHRGRWGMFYFGLAYDGHARELLALGDTLTDFRKVDEVLIDVGPPGSIEEKSAHKPSVI